ncbi:MAG: hypothetical protein AAFV95_02090 [Bacteroidota bacterium]
MKHLWIIWIYCGIGSSLLAQNSAEGLPISVSYFSQAVYQPGAKIGTQLNLRQWQRSYERKSNTYLKEQSIFVGPQLGFWMLPNDHRFVLLNAEIGYRYQKSRRQTFSAFSIGLGHLLQSRVESFSVDLGGGDIGDKDRVSSHHFMPSLNYAFGKAINSKISWFSRLSYGLKLASNDASRAFFLVEVGVWMNPFSSSVNQQQ